MMMNTFYFLPIPPRIPAPNIQSNTTKAKRQKKKLGQEEFENIQNTELFQNKTKNQENYNSEFFIKNPNPDILNLEEKCSGDILLVDVITDDPFVFVDGVLIPMT
jgi:hypothetical protein